MRSQSLRGALPWLALTGLAVAVVVVIVLAVPVQLALVILGLIVGASMRNRTAVLVFAVILIPTLGLIRRLVAGPAAYVEADPLILLPLVLVIGVVVFSWTNERTDKSTRASRVFALTTIVGVAVTVVLTASFSVDGLFYAGLIIVPLLLATALSTGRLPEVWNAVTRVLPIVSFAVGLYGIYQFFVLPEWDRAWMRSSLLTSIGHPLPLQVRVFGASESPGPYALFLGLMITLCLAAAIREKRAQRVLGWLALGGFLAFPLLLSGVRSALLGVGLCVLVLALIRARGFTRIVLVAFIGGAYYLLTFVLDRFGAGSTILTADRYTAFTAQDDSLVARLNMLASVGNPLQYIIGNPNAPTVDNLYIDTLLRYGLLAAVALLLLVFSVTALALRQLATRTNETAALAAVFIATQTIFGPTFNSLFGILVGVVFGTVMAVPRQKREAREPVRARRNGSRARATLPR